MARRGRQRIDITGARFAHLLIISFAGLARKKKALWLCRCDCGREKVILGESLRAGSTRSCGCKKAEWIAAKKRRHGQSGGAHGADSTREYQTWQAMKSRCLNRNNADYKNYGGRGIAVCERWLSFENFFADMGKRPSRVHSLDRLDVNGNYEAANCRWATPQQQRDNQRPRFRRQIIPHDAGEAGNTAVKYGAPPTDDVREWLSYDPATGVFRWRRAPNGAQKCGEIAGRVHAETGYRTIFVLGRSYTAGRLAWWFVHNEWPQHDIDHENRNRGDDRIDNLRIATRTQNARNRKCRRENATALKGVSLHKQSQRWRARIKVGEKNWSLGLFASPEAAARAYDAAATQHFGEFAHLNFPALPAQ